MTATATLFDPEPFAPIAVDRSATIDEQFQAFHEANRWVYDALVQLARQRVEAGRKVGIKALVERLRWDWELATTGDTWKLNNNFTSRYARLMMSREADLVGLFETRELRAA